MTLTQTQEAPHRRARAGVMAAGAGQFTADPQLQRALMTIAETPDSRRPLLLLAEILRTPGLFERLAEVLRPEKEAGGGRDGGSPSSEQPALRN